MINEVVTILYYQNSPETPRFGIFYAGDSGIYRTTNLRLVSGDEDSVHLRNFLSIPNRKEVNLALGLESRPPLLNVFRITEERHSTLQELVDEHNGKFVIPGD